MHFARVVGLVKLLLDICQLLPEVFDFAGLLEGVLVALQALQLELELDQVSTELLILLDIDLKLLVLRNQHRNHRAVLLKGGRQVGELAEEGLWVRAGKDLAELLEFLVLAAIRDLKELNKFVLLLLLQLHLIIELLEQLDGLEGVVGEALGKGLPDLVVVDFIDEAAEVGLLGGFELVLDADFVNLPVSRADFVERLVKLDYFGAVDLDLED